MSKLTDILSKNIFYAKGADKLFFSVDETEDQIIALIDEIINSLHNNGEYEDWGTYSEGFEGAREQMRKATAALTKRGDSDESL